MIPTLPIGPLRLQTYGLVALLAYFLGTALAARLARRGPDGRVYSDHVYNASFYSLLAWFIAARLGHAVAYFPAYRNDLGAIFALSPGAFLPAAGVMGVALALFLYVRRYRLAWGLLLDYLAAGSLLGLALLAVGAFLAGRDPGISSAAPWAVEWFGVRRHPVGLYQAAALLALLATLLWRQRQGTWRPGDLALRALFGYAALRLFVEPLRAGGPFVGDGWRAGQIAAWAVVALAGYWLARRASSAGAATE